MNYPFEILICIVIVFVTIILRHDGYSKTGRDLKAMENVQNDNRLKGLAIYSLQAVYHHGDFLYRCQHRPQGHVY